MLNKKFDSSGQNLKIKALISRAQPKEVKPNKIIDIPFIDSCVLNYVEDIKILANFMVQEDGLYQISNQVCIKVDQDCEVNVIQSGMCDLDLLEFGRCLDSKVINAPCIATNVISNNLCTFRYLEKGMKYIAWINVVSSNNSFITYDKDFSHLQLIKLSC